MRKRKNDKKNISTKQRKKKKKIGFRARMATVGGRKVINARRKKGRQSLSA